ncbi:MAG: DUF1049 domain-containing protein [Bacteroidetes bacterium]|nr:DUF1049 domain-containing protein [Bacteroidota bacterium]
MRKTILLTLAIVILILTVVFTLQNTSEIQVNLLFWNIKTSSALLIFVSFSLGILLAISFLTPSIINLKRQLHESKSIIKKFKKMDVSSTTDKSATQVK